MYFPRNASISLVYIFSYPFFVGSDYMSEIDHVQLMTPFILVLNSCHEIMIPASSLVEYALRIDV
jgi:hypothetical protein